MMSPSSPSSPTSSMPSGNYMIGLVYAKGFTTWQIQVQIWPTLPTKGYLRWAWDTTSTLCMKTSMSAPRTRVAICLRHGAKMKELGACVIVNKHVWEQLYLSHIFNRSSRKLRRHVHISTGRIRYLLMCTHFPFVFVVILFD